MLTRVLVPLLGGGFTPDRIPGLKLWLAADRSTLWQDSARTTPAVAEADPVGAWDDLSGNGNHVTQATGTKRPTLRLNVQNGLPVLRFDGVDDLLRVLVAIIPSGNFSAFVCFKTSTAASQYIVAHGTLASGAFILLAGTSTNPSIRAMVDGTNLFAGTSSVSGAFVVSRVVYDFSSTPKTTLSKNGLQENTQSFTANYSSDNLTVGGGASTASGLWVNGDVGEILIYDSALNISQISRLDYYCRSKWGTP